MRLILTLLIMLQFNAAFSQVDKKVEKAVNTFKEGKLDKSIKMMEKITAKNSTDENWYILVSLYHERYKFARTNANDAAVAAIGNLLGADMEQEKYTSPNICFKDFINSCRKSNLYSQNPIASQLLRNYLIDYEPDTAVSKVALKEFEQAEKFFADKDYSKSKFHYQNALDLQANYYNATIYLGDSYWYLEDMDSAIYYFRAGIAMHPDLLEPRKYLVDALGFDKKYEAAKKECLEAIYIYPDQTMFEKYADIIKKENKSYNQHWTKRGCEINNIQWEETKTRDKVWSAYQSAEQEIIDYCDERGVVVKPNAPSKAKYLEVYAWEQMLKSSTTIPEELSFAKKMADEGYLDCYVFISVFHYDLYGQYLDFVKNNQEKIKTYIETYLVE